MQLLTNNIDDTVFGNWFTQRLLFFSSGCPKHLGKSTWNHSGQHAVLGVSLAAPTASPQHARACCVLHSVRCSWAFCVFSNLDISSYIFPLIVIFQLELPQKRWSKMDGYSLPSLQMVGWFSIHPIPSSSGARRWMAVGPWWSTPSSSRPSPKPPSRRVAPRIPKTMRPGRCGCGRLRRHGRGGYRLRCYEMSHIFLAWKK